MAEAGMAFWEAVEQLPSLTSGTAICTVVNPEPPEHPAEGRPWFGLLEDKIHFL